MRKGKRVRILKTGELGTIADQVIIKKQGKPHKYCQVKLDANPQLDRWYYADQLGDTIEQCTVTFKDDRNQTLVFDVRRNYDKETVSIELTGSNPNNLEKHRGINSLIFKALTQGFEQIK